ncbi:MAG: FMN-binding negative transcriptional regulator [Pseudomonadota bacterium]|nr:transcriptional regulator [Alteromonadaceae bacterium]MDY6928272.1 FMN-binding negative transcriptional regulator [Pseudomonadota bacterium]RPH20001.1 MAG: FMN-binding negative transcriptional regulator [Alteromonadaceae bacterium TMED7]|tara:strand:+ start:2541 stop:3155 length:615 start_codon:yes stop_codon:yes gene_type:complete
MFVPSAFSFTDTVAQLAFIKAHSFALITTPDLQTTHMPLLVRQEGDSLFMIGHMARANRHWQALDNTPVVAVFSGPHAYISPKWYASEPNVPTWNYVAVHAKGRVSVMNDEALPAALNELMQAFEPDYNPETLDTALIDYQQKLIRGIVGIEIKVDCLQGVRKLGQHKNAADMAGVCEGLKTSGDHESLALLDYMQRHGIGYAD